MNLRSSLVGSRIHEEISNAVPGRTRIQAIEGVGGRGRQCCKARPVPPGVVGRLQIMAGGVTP